MEGISGPLQGRQLVPHPFILINIKEQKTNKYGIVSAMSY